ncbi:MAG TPA: TonB-dependent receptor [Steroidobacteraceae bacterium]|nr:TonB-dependent receptor [Steroidobacteraceae bacterium]
MRRLTRSIGALAATWLAVGIASGASPGATLATAIAPQPLDLALEAFSDQTGLQLFFVAEIAKARDSAGAPAGLAPPAAIEALLAGTGLHFEFVNPRAVRVYAVPAPAPARYTASAQAAEDARTAPAALDEILVTANRRLERARDVPIDMAIWSRDDLDVVGALGIVDIAQLTPATQFQNVGDVGAGAATYLSIRGVADRYAPTTGLYLDDTPLPQAGANTFLHSFPFAFDLDRVEVLRGPQLQLFSEGNQGGVIRFIFTPASLTDFTALARGDLSVPARGDSSSEAGAAIGAPLLVDQLGVRVDAWRREDGGYVDRVDPLTGVTLDRNSNRTISETARVALAFAPWPTVRITPSLTYAEVEVRDSPFFFTNLSNTASAQLGNGHLVAQPFRDAITLGAVKVAANLGTQDLTSVTSFFARQLTANLDQTYAFDWGSPLGPGYPLGTGDAILDRHDLRQQSFMQELRLASADRKARLAWDVAAFYSSDRTHDAELWSGQAGIPGLLSGPFAIEDLTSSAKTRLAALADVALRISSQLTLSAGIHGERQRYHERLVLAPAVVAQGADSLTLPRAAVTYQVDKDRLWYLTVAKGYGNGGVALPEFGCGDGVVYGPDTLWSYELGSKNRLLDGQMQLDVAAYHIAWNNGHGYHLGTLADPTPCVLFGDPGSAASNGFDLALEALATARLRFRLSVAYTDAHYTHTLPVGAAVAERSGDAVGTLNDFTPIAPWAASLTADYAVALGRSTTALVVVTDAFRSRNPGPFACADPTSVYYTPGFRPDPSTNFLNVRAVLERPGYDLTVYVSNVFDSRPTIERTTLNAANGSLFEAATFRSRTLGVAAAWRY